MASPSRVETIFFEARREEDGEGGASAPCPQPKKTEG